MTWTRRDSRGTTGFARRTRASNRSAVGPVQSLGTVAYGVPRVALGASGAALATWNARGPGAAANVGLASAEGIGARPRRAEHLRRGRLQPDLADPRVAGVHAAGPLHAPDRRHLGRAGAGGRRRPGDGRRHAAADAGSNATPAVAHSGASPGRGLGRSGRRRRGQHRSLMAARADAPRPSCCIHERHAAAAQRPRLRRAQPRPGSHREPARRRLGRRRGRALGVDAGHRARRRAPWP